MGLLVSLRRLPRDGLGGFACVAEWGFLVSGKWGGGERVLGLWQGSGCLLAEFMMSAL